MGPEENTSSRKTSPAEDTGVDLVRREEGYSVFLLPGPIAALVWSGEIVPALKGEQRHLSLQTMHSETEASGGPPLPGSCTR